VRVADLVDRGVHLEVRGDDLVVRGVVEPDLIEGIRRHKHRLIAELLGRECCTCSHWWRSDVVNQAGEALGDCLLLNLETAAGENCKGHDAQQGSARRARR
jgi:hypothetical protein